MTDKIQVADDFVYKKLLDLGYRHNVLEGGYVSGDLATIVINTRRPYIGQVMQYSQHKVEEHLKNIEELRSMGFLK